MKRLYLISIVAASFLSNSTSAATVDKWNSGEIDGFTRYWTTNNEGSSFVVWCHPKRRLNGTLLQVLINNKFPPPNSRVTVILDRQALDMPVNKQGYIETNCATCSDSFGYVWHMLRSSHSLVVKFPDDQFAGFSLRGAQEILPGPVCPTDWEKNHSGT